MLQKVGSFCKELATCRLDEKAKWLGEQMKLMIERGELTADEQGIAAEELAAKLERMREKAQ